MRLWALKLSSSDSGSRYMKFNNWKSNKEKYLPKLKSLGMLRFTVLRVWNKEGAFRLGYIFEYEDEKKYKKCQPIWQEIERKSKDEALVKIFANRGIVLEDNDLT